MMFSLCLDQLAARLVHLACFLAWRLVVRLALLHDGEVLRHTTATSAGDAILAEQLFDVGIRVGLRRCVDAHSLTGRAAEDRRSVVWGRRGSVGVEAVLG